MSGFHFLPPVQVRHHQAEPVEDGWYEELTGLIANLANELRYPVVGVCKKCHARIRIAGIGQEWEHVPDGDGTAR